MPDILIRGVDMPKKCGVCPCFTAEQGAETCNPLDRNVDGEGQPEPDCPLHELPEHGDLISRDEAVSVLQNIGSRDYRREKGTICDAIKMISHSQYVPTIVPASEEDTPNG